MKGNAIASRSFPSFAALEAHLERWTREVADLRIHGTTGEAPAIRSARDACEAVGPCLDGFVQWRESSRTRLGRAGRLKPVDIAARLKALERENRELRQANELLRKASACFAQAEVDRRYKP